MAAGTALNVSLFSALSNKRGMSRNCWQNIRNAIIQETLFFTITNVLLLPAKVE